MSMVSFPFLVNFHIRIVSLVFVEDAQKKNPFPCPCSYRTALTYYLDLTSLPNTQILKDLAQYATDEDEKALLTLMGSYSDEGRVNKTTDLYSPNNFFFLSIRLNTKNGFSIVIVRLLPFSKIYHH